MASVSRAVEARLAVAEVGAVAEVEAVVRVAEVVEVGADLEERAAVALRRLAQAEVKPMPVWMVRRTWTK